MKLEGKKVLVVGAGKSGIAASELLLDKKLKLFSMMETKIWT